MNIDRLERLASIASKLEPILQAGEELSRVLTLIECELKPEPEEMPKDCPVTVRLTVGDALALRDLCRSVNMNDHNVCGAFNKIGDAIELL